MDVAAWLRELGLEQYAAAFIENSVSIDLLPSLTADDLKDLGVAAVGHRRRLLNAVAGLSPGVDAPGGEHTEEPKPASPEAGERRQLSVVFCDISGSTALSTRLDPEDLSTVVRAYQARVRATITRFRGFIARYVGDGVLIYFGWPEAHETDAERAVRAALAVIEAVGRSPIHGERLSIRIGIATGLVVVGAPIGEGELRQQTAIGDTPNLAARLQALAVPNYLVIAESTRRQVGTLFALDDLGPQTLAGFQGTQRAWRVLGETRQASRFEALRSQMAPLVGRDEELDLLLRRWTRAVSGEGQIVLISGEPGIGKSRLVASLQERLREDRHVRLPYFCSPQRTDTALYPIVAQLEHAAGINPDEPPLSQFEKLEQLLSVGMAATEERALIAALLGLNIVHERYPPLHYTPQIRKQKTLEALLRQLENLARDQPILMIFEDAHWSDPTSLELLDRTIEQVRRLSVLLLVTFRPEFSPPWIAQPHVALVALRRLDAQESAKLAAHFGEGRILRNEVLEDIISRSDGVPLFLEELTKAVMESTSDPEGVVQRVQPSSTGIPAALYASLTARLDRLGPAKEIAQIGAVVGREFSYELLRELSPSKPEWLHSALDQLVASGLALQRGVPPAATYQFKHALVQQSAYEMLLRSDRRRLHARLADLLENLPEMTDRQPELLAQHFAAADLNEKAVEYWMKAGARSVARSAMREAEAQFDKALARVPLLPDGSERLLRELELQSSLGSVRLAISGFAAPHVADTYARAHELWQRLDSPPEYLRVAWGQIMYYVNRGDLERTRELAEGLTELARQRPDPAAVLPARFCMGGVELCSGNFVASRAHLEEGDKVYHPGLRELLTQTLGMDPHVMVLQFLGLVLCFVGYPARGLAYSKRAIDEGREGQHRPSLASALSTCTRLAICLGDEPFVANTADELVALATEQGFPYWRSVGAIYQGWVQVRQGEEHGLMELRAGAAAYRKTGAELWSPIHDALEAEAEALFGRSDAALRTLEIALSNSRKRGENWYEAELLRRRGELLLDRDRSMAERLFREAIGVAVRQGAKLWELRATTSLARLWASAGRAPDARNLLAPLYEWFREDFNTPDLKAAGSLLDTWQ